jgi:integrase
MSLRKRQVKGRTRWDVRWREGDRQRSRGFDRKEDAQAFEADVRRRAQLGAHAPAEPSKETVQEWVRRWWTRDGARWAESTRMQRAHLLDKWIIPFIGGVRLRDLGQARVREWQTEAAGHGCSAHQQNQALRVLSAVLGAAVRDGLLPANPCIGVRKAPHRSARPRALTPLEVERIRAAMPTGRDAVMVSLIAYGGLRPEELVALRWGDITGPVIVVDRAYTCGELKGTKSGARRSVEIVAPLAVDLDAYRPHVTDDEALVAPSQVGGFLHWGNWRNRVWNPACEAAGVKAAPYDLRHTFCSLLIHEGRSPLLVAAAMGHASGQLIWTTYGHVFEHARLAPNVSMVDAIEQARTDLRADDVPRMCHATNVRVLRAMSGAAIK